MKAYSGTKVLELLKPEKIIDEVRKEYSKENLDLNKEQEKALAPFVEDKIQRLRDKLLKTLIIPPKEKVTGLIAIEVPLGTKKLTIKVTTPKGNHKFDFSVIEL